MSENTLAEAATKIARVLESVEVDQRRRVIRTALMLLGDDSPSESTVYSRPADNAETLQHSPGNSAELLMRRLGLTMEQLEKVLHFENGAAHVIGVPGGTQSKREQTMNIYLLAGLGAAVSSLEARFSDTEARNLCVQFGCYDAPNHVRIVRALGNKITGSKESGWKLTSPGLSAAAALVKS